MTMTDTITPAKAWIGSNGHPVYATAEDFKTFWDVNTTFLFYDDEDGAGVYGFGHQDKAQFAASVNEYDQLACGVDPSEANYTSNDVTHCWAVLLDPRNPDDGMRFSWHGVDSMTLGSWPLTRIPR